LFTLIQIDTYLIRVGTAGPTKCNRLAGLEGLGRPGSERKRVGKTEGDDGCHSGNNTLREKHNE
jgi:hypothetical protein